MQWVCFLQLTVVVMVMHGNVEAIQKRSDDTNPMEAVLAQHSAELQALKASLAAMQTTVDRLDQNVAFRVGVHGTYLTGLNANVVVNFPNVYLNEGSGYDHVSGRFEAPVAGTYAFFLRLQSAGSGSAINTAIYHEGHSIGYAYVDDSDGSETASTMVTVDLDQGEAVWVQVLSNNADNARGDDRTLFTGFLVHAR